MKSSLLVSVIIPCFNQGNFLSESLDSVLEQTYPHWECIIINDGSPDNTDEIAQFYCNKDKRFRYLQKKNGGLSSARNAGLKVMLGEYVQFLDADDLLVPEKIQRQISFLESNEEYFISYCNTMRFTEYFSNKASYFYQPVNKLEKPLVDLLRRDMLFPIPIHSILIKGDVFRQVGFFDEKLKSAEDRDFWMRTAIAGFRFYHQDFYGIYYREHLKSMNFDTRQMYTGMYAFTVKMERMLRKKGLLNNEIKKNLIKNYIYVINANKDYKDIKNVKYRLRKMKTSLILSKICIRLRQKFSLGSLVIC